MPTLGVDVPVSTGGVLDPVSVGGVLLPVLPSTGGVAGGGGGVLPPFPLPLGDGFESAAAAVLD